MNKSAIQKFAVSARTALIEQVSQRAYQYGITKDGYGEANAATVNGVALSREEQEQRRQLVREIQAKGFDLVMEEVAYTWFNRFVALRYMEVNNYLPSHIRVFSNAAGEFDPEIMKEALHLDLPGLDRNRVAEYIEKSQNDDLYSYLLLTQCGELKGVIPEIFDSAAHIELLRPNNLLRTDSVPYHMVTEIPEEDWLDKEANSTVQIIGWLYQYYISEKHNEVVNINKSVVDEKDIPAATQLFTTDWVVQYMVDNSLGRYWIERNPDSKLAEKLYYFVTPKDGQIRYINERVSPTELTIMDPCVGSGHVLVYAFDVLMEIYKEQGYTERDAAAAIVEHNLFGLDVDERAVQLANLAVMMKARKYDRRFFGRGIRPRIMQTRTCGEPANAGSLLLVKELGAKPVEQDEFNLFVGEDALDWEFRNLLHQKYTAVVTNPPYLNKYHPALKKYVLDNFKDYSGDLFSVFVYRNLLLCKPEGYCGFMTPFVWMFIKTYEKLREFIIQNKSIATLIQMEYSAYEEATVPICSFVLKNGKENTNGLYFKLSDFKGGMEVQRQKVREALENKDCGYFYKASAANFSKIPGSPIAYWVSNQLFDIFQNYPSLEAYASPKQGLITGDNDRFLKYWYEVSTLHISFERNSGLKWVPINKGGEFRRWYGNQEYVVNWGNNGFEILNFKDEKGKLKSRPQNLSYNFRESLSWSLVTSGGFSVRYFPDYFMFNVAGISCFPSKHLNYILGLLNTNITSNITQILNPTINMNAGDVAKVPIVISDKDEPNIDCLVIEIKGISRNDWDSYETSWDFKRHPLV